MSLIAVERLREVAELEFADIVVEAFVPDINELRIILIDGSENHVLESHLSREPEQALREFLIFAREKLRTRREEQGRKSRGARVQGSRGEREQGSRGAEGAGEQRRKRDQPLTN